MKRNYWIGWIDGELFSWFPTGTFYFMNVEIIIDKITRIQTSTIIPAWVYIVKTSHKSGKQCVSHTKIWNPLLYPKSFLIVRAKVFIEIVHLPKWLIELINSAAAARLHLAFSNKVTKFFLKRADIRLEREIELNLVQDGGLADWGVYQIDLVRLMWAAPIPPEINLTSDVTVRSCGNRLFSFLKGNFTS